MGSMTAITYTVPAALLLFPQSLCFQQGRRLESRDQIAGKTPFMRRFVPR